MRWTIKNNILISTFISSVHSSSLRSSADGFNPSLFVANLTAAYPAECSAINRTLLDSPISDPRKCNVAVALGQKCALPCKFAMRSMGEACYKLAVAVGVADPIKVGSNATVAFNQCTEGVVYTTADNYKPAVIAIEAPEESVNEEGGELVAEKVAAEVEAAGSSGVRYAPQAISLVILCIMTIV